MAEHIIKLQKDLRGEVFASREEELVYNLIKDDEIISVPCLLERLHTNIRSKYDNDILIKQRLGKEKDILGYINVLVAKKFVRRIPYREIKRVIEVLK